MTSTKNAAIRKLLSAAVVLTSISATDLAEAGEGRSRRARTQLEIPRARVALDFDSQDALVIRTGFHLAFQRVKEVAACGALFSNLDLDGLTALRSTTYTAARPGPERALCDRRAHAVTRTGSREIRLCPRLRSLAQEGVAAILIHEALHTAGLGEFPVDPEAPTSAQITRAVLAACSLG